MPYTDADDENLPAYVKSKPDYIRTNWIKIFNTIAEREGEKLAFIVANKWLLRQKTKKEVEAKTVSITRVKLELSNEGGLIKRTKDGDDYVDFVLTDTQPDLEGRFYTSSLLQEWAESINKGEVIVGDIDHEEYDKILAQYINEEDVVDAFKNKKGIAKAVKASFDKGRLWVRALIDKRYKALIEKANGVSLEAIVNFDAANCGYKGSLLGFTFAVNQEPYNPRAVIA